MIEDRALRSIFALIYDVNREEKQHFRLKTYFRVSNMQIYKS